MRSETPPPTRTSVGVIGLGQMGRPIARQLLCADVHVVGCDIDPDRARRAAAEGVELRATPREVVDQATCVITSLPSPDALMGVLDGPDGLLARGRGLTLIELSTLDLGTKERARDAVEAAGGEMLDCPVSGTAMQAEAGDLVVYASGDPQVISRHSPILDAFSRRWFDVGPFGHGSVMKYAANLLVAIHNAAAAEALVFAARGGLDPWTAFEVLSAGAGTSRMLEVRGPDIISGDYRAGSGTGRTFSKDLSIIHAFATDVGCPTPIFSLVSELFTSTRARGHITDDTSSVAAVFRELAGLGEGPLQAVGPSDGRDPLGDESE